jgi:putative DNA primase/helicase
MPRKSKPLAKVASAIKPKKADWIWAGRIAKGCVTVVVGDPGVAKSQIAVTLAAKVSKGGIWPCGGGSAPEGDVVMLIGEDDLAERTKPLLMAANANLGRVHLIGDHDNENYKPINLFDEKDRLRIGDVLIIDPLGSFVDSRVNNANAARELLAELTHGAKCYNIAVVLICHLTKSGARNALSMIAGSSAIAAIARAVYMAMEDEPGSEFRLLTCVKNNLAPDNITLRYRVEPKKVGGISTTRIVWHKEPLRMTADQALAKVKVNGAKSMRPQAIDGFLNALLADGKRAASEILAQAVRIHPEAAPDSS